MVNKGSHLPEAGNVFVSQGLLTISVRSGASNELVIKGAAHAKAEKMKKSFDGIKIRYR